MNEENNTEEFSLYEEIGLSLADHHDAETEKEKMDAAKRVQILYSLSNEEKRIDNEFEIAEREAEIKTREQDLKEKELELKEKEIEVTAQTAKNEYIADMAKLVAGAAVSAFGFTMTAGICFYSWYMDKNGTIPRSKTHVKPLGLLEHSMKIFKI